MKKRHILIIILVTILLIPVLKPYLRYKVVCWRVSSALDFPKKGYLTEHSEIFTKVTIEVEPNKDTFAKPQQLNLNTTVEITNNGNSDLQFMIAAAKLCPEVADFTDTGQLYIVMNTPVDLPSQNSEMSNKTVFDIETCLKSLTNSELKALNKLLQEPVLIKIVHNSGVELLEVKPEVVTSSMQMSSR